MQSENPTFHQKLEKQMKQFRDAATLAGNPNLLMPPPSVAEMSTEYLEGDFKTKLKAKFPFEPRYRNPVSYYQGGMLGAAFDNVMGPLSYMAFLAPCVTLELHTRFVRPFTAEDDYMTIECTITSLTKNILTIRGEAYSKTGKLIALASCTSMKTLSKS